MKKLLLVLLMNPILFSYSQIKLPVIFGDGMVLQRDQIIKIWGNSGSNEKITIQFDGKRYATKADQMGNWNIKLGKMSAGGPFKMHLKGTNEIEIKDIYIGDVWFCSGQSNMVLNMERVKEKYPEEIETANYPEIRNFFIPTSADPANIHHDLPGGKWKSINPISVLEMGAATFFFAKNLYEKYHIPIGIINSSVGGTPIEAWISESGLKNFPDMIQISAKYKDTSFMNDLKSKINNATGRALQKIIDKGLSEKVKWYEESYQPKGWRNIMVPGYWADQGIKNLNGVVWYRKEIILPADFKEKAAKLFLGRIVDADQAYVNGKQVGNITYQYPPRRYEVPNGFLRPGKNTIVVRITNTTGKGGFVPDKPCNLLIGNERIDLRGEWQYKVGEVFQTTPNIQTITLPTPQNTPTGLYNTMVAPLIDYANKGFVWYQGETNSGRPEEYKRLLPALINDWRDKWNDSTKSFIYAQLPNYMEMQYTPSESNWAILRESQSSAISIPHTAMSVNIDAGEWNDIHPLNKKDVGFRLALGARKVAYNEKDLVSSGPIMESSQIEGNKIIITFREVGSGLIAKDDDQLNYFAIAGDDKKFVWAKALINGNKVIVWNENISNPKFVRYAWADNPHDANLYNKEGLPASPFRTDH